MGAASKVKAAWPWFVIIMGLGVTAALVATFVGLHKVELLEPAGGFMGGLAALLAVLWAMVKGPQEWHDWLRRKRAEKVAEVAGEVIVSAVKYREALTFMNPAVVLSSGSEEAGKLRGIVEAKWALIANERAAYEVAAIQAEAYLPCESLKHIIAFSRLAQCIRIKWDQVIRCSPGGTYEDASSAGQAKTTITDTNAELASTVGALKAELRTHTLADEDVAT